MIQSETRRSWWSLSAVILAVAAANSNEAAFAQVPVIRPATVPIRKVESSVNTPRLIPIKSVTQEAHPTQAESPLPPIVRPTRMIPIIQPDEKSSDADANTPTRLPVLTPAQRGAQIDRNSDQAQRNETGNQVRMLPVIQASPAPYQADPVEEPVVESRMNRVTGSGAAFPESRRTPDQVLPVVDVQRENGGSAGAKSNAAIQASSLPVVQVDQESRRGISSGNSQPSSFAPPYVSSQAGKSPAASSGPGQAVPIIKPSTPLGLSTFPSGSGVPAAGASFEPKLSPAVSNATIPNEYLPPPVGGWQSQDLEESASIAPPARQEMGIQVGENYLESGLDDDCGGCGACASCARLGMRTGYGVGGRLRPAGHLRHRIRSRVAGTLPSVWGPVSNCGFDDCGFISPADRYLQLDALYWTRGDGGVVGTNFGGPADYPWNWGWRSTLGWRADAIRGYELSYFGFLPFEESVTQNSPGGAINARFLPAGGLGAAQTSGFYNAVNTVQDLETQFHSVDFSRVRFGWDVVKTSLGMRYMWFEDRYRLQSQNNVGDVGVFQMHANNHLFGPDVGLELLYDVGRRISFSGKAKGGAYLDIYRMQTRLSNNGTQYIGSENNSTNLSASLELGANAYLRLGRNARLRGGYDALWLYNVLSVSENFPGLVTPITGFDPDDSRQVTLHGASFGLEFYR